MLDATYKLSNQDIFTSAFIGGSSVLVVDFFNASPHIETSLEIGLRLAELGANVNYAFCGEALDYNEGYDPSLFATSIRDSFARSRCNTYQQLVVSRAKAFAEERGLAFSPMQPLASAKPNIPLSLRTSLISAVSLQQINRIKWGDMSIGLAVGSSLSWYSKSASLNPSSHSDLVLSIASSYLVAYQLVSEYIRLTKCDYLVVFNGRFAPCRAAQDAGKRHGVPVLFHERGADLSRFSLRSYMPHDIAGIKGEIDKTWQDGCKTNGLERCQDVASRFFSRKREGDGFSWKSFVQNQETGPGASLLQSLRCRLPGKIIVTYFQSSDDEYVSVGENLFPPGPFGYQLEAFKVFMAAAIAEGCHVVVRMHPHMSEKCENDLSAWTEIVSLYSEFCTIVGPESPVSSYELVDDSDMVVVYHSTVGVESIFSGRPTIVLGRPFYDCHGAGFFAPSSFADLRQSIAEAAALTTGFDTVIACPYGYWASTHGIHFKYFRPSGISSGTFLGVDRSALVRGKSLSGLLKSAVARLNSLLRVAPV